MTHPPSHLRHRDPTERLGDRVESAATIVAPPIFQIVLETSERAARTEGQRSVSGES